MSTLSFQKAVQPRGYNKSFIRKSNVSYGVLLFDDKDNFLVLKNPFSYALASFLHNLCDYNFVDYEFLFGQFDVQELELIRNNWNENGLNVIIKTYLEKSFESDTDPTHNALKEKFKRCSVAMNRNWRCLLQINNVDKFPTKTYPRMHKFPVSKGPEKKKLQTVCNVFFNELGLPLPDDVAYKSWKPVSYCGCNNIEYKLELLVGKCKHFDIPKTSKAVWVPVQDVKNGEVHFVTEISNVIVNEC